MTTDDTRTGRLGGLLANAVLDREGSGLFGLIARSGLLPMYLLLLALARSKSDLRHLHDNQVKANRRLLRADFMDLERKWTGLYPKDQSPRGGTRPDDDTCGMMLNITATREEHRPDRTILQEFDLTTYYLDALQRGRRQRWDHLRFDQYSHRVYSSVLTVDQGGGEYFRCTMFGRTFEVLIQTSFDNTKIGVRFDFWERTLDEPLTHRLLTELPTFMRHNLGLFSGDGEHRVGIGWELDAAELFPGLTPADTMCAVRPPRVSWIATEQFFAKLNELMRALGVPLDTPIAPATTPVEWAAPFPTPA